MKKLAVVTATRAEYGALIPVIRTINEDMLMELELIVTGMHLSEKYGYTYSFIMDDGFPISYEIPILAEGNTPYDISITMSNALKGFAECFKKERPDMLLISGDRTEMLAVASAAMNERIPIAHIHGGEVTEGAVDDCVRHALTKMSYLHFTSTEEYRRRVIQLGEEPDRVFNVGALSAENILCTQLLEETEVRSLIGIPYDRPYVVVTFHPVTLECGTAEKQVLELCKAIEMEPNFFFLITMSNADTGGDIINRVLERFAEKRKNVKWTSNLGMVRYLSVLKYATYVLGNSSSGITEAPVLGVPTVNIGDRQKGRLMAETIINCDLDYESIYEAMNKAQKIKHRVTDLFGDGNTSKKIIEIIKELLLNYKINLKKGFYTLDKKIDNPC